MWDFTNTCIPNNIFFFFFLTSNKLYRYQKKYTRSVQGSTIKNKNYKNQEKQKEKRMIGFAKQTTNPIKFWRKKKFLLFWVKIIFLDVGISLGKCLSWSGSISSKPIWILPLVEILLLVISWYPPKQVFGRWGQPRNPQFLAVDRNRIRVQRWWRSFFHLWIQTSRILLLQQTNMRRRSRHSCW